MAEGRLKELTPADMTPEQKRVVESIQSGPRGSGLRGPFNALLRSPDLCDVVQKVGAYIRFSSSISSASRSGAIAIAVSFQAACNSALASRVPLRPTRTFSSWMSPSRRSTH